VKEHIYDRADCGLRRGSMTARDRDVAADRSPERLARAGLTRVVERGTPMAATTFGTSGVVESWERLRARGDDVRAWLPRLENADPEADLDRAAEMGARFVIPGDSEWPRGIGGLAPPDRVGGWSSLPFGLWVRGAADLDDLLERAVASMSRAISRPDWRRRG
jgi:DNA processing protein